MGVGFAFFIVPNATLILLSVPPAKRGTASALVAETQVAGQSLSNAVAIEKLLKLSALLLILSAVAVATAVLSTARYIAMRL